MIKDKIIQSEIRNMSAECDRVNGINLSQGISERRLDNVIESGAIEAIRNGNNQYSRFDGVKLLRESIADKLMNYNGINYNSKKNIVVSNGATGALFCSLIALFEKGDEIILFQPYYGYHLNTILYLGLKPKFANLDIYDLSFSEKELQSLITEKTKAIIICTPSNPCGKIFSEDELKIVAKFCNKNNLILITDEIYEYYIYDDYRHISPAFINSIFDNTITISGYSKTFSITGWRVGYVACREDWARLIGYINDLIYVCSPTPLQIGVANGISKIPNNFYTKLRKDFEVYRDKICDTLIDIGFNPIIPNGSYYVLADVQNIEGENSKEKAMFILSKTGIATVPGTAFFNDSIGQDFVRFCFAVEKDMLDEACRRLKNIK